MVILVLAWTIIILSSLWIQVKIDVAINEWFGQFYDMIQKALASPNAITINEYWESLISFLTLAGVYVAVAVLVSFFTAHFCLDGELQWLSGTTVYMTSSSNRRCCAESTGGHNKVHKNYGISWNKPC